MGDALEDAKAELEAMRRQLEKKRFEFLPGLIAMSLITILAFAIACLFLVPMPMTEAAGTLAIALVTAVATNVGVIVGFFFGSSKTSREKDDTASTQAQTISHLANSNITSATTPATTPAAVAAVIENTTATKENTVALDTETALKPPVK